MMSIKEKYKKEVIPKMKEKFGYKNDFAVPKIEKAVVNVGIGKVLNSIDPSKKKELKKGIFSDISLICGQSPVLTRAIKAIAGFKVRQGSTVGVKATLRRSKMNDFLDRLINVVLPRMRDFQGVPKTSIDDGGNLTVGIKEHIVFPEIQPEKVKKNFSLQVTVVTNAKKKEEAIELFKLLGFPIKK